MAEQVARFRFTGFVINKSLIEILKQDVKGGKLSVEFQLSGKNFSKENRYELNIVAKVTDEDNSINIEVDAIANYEYEAGITSEEKDIYFYTSAPAILFPYIRAHVGTISNLSGINPIMLPTLNLTQKGEELRTHTVEIN